MWVVRLQYGKPDRECGLSDYNTVNLVESVGCQIQYDKPGRECGLSDYNTVNLVENVGCQITIR